MVFIVLCYRETRDLIKLISNLNEQREELAIVIVNSYYDEATKDEFEKIANENNCDFLNVENKGYGYGNNRGLEFANEKYQYDFLCICNPDIVFKRFPTDRLTEDLHGSIIAPSIITKNGKKQNPYYYFHVPLIDWLKYIGLIRNKRFAYYLGVAINKIFRIALDKINFKSKVNIYACHGACFFIGHVAAKELGLPYNEEMFLFHEEEHLARLTNKLSIPILFDKAIEVLHFEDGSSESIKDSTFMYMKQSYSEYYNFWYNRD